MAEKYFKITWPDDNGPEWMNVDNLMLCINAYCKNNKVTAEEVDPHGDGESNG